MESTTLRQKLHHLIDTTSEDKLKEIYDSFQEEEYSEDFKAMLDSEFEQYQREGKGIKREEIDNIIEHFLYHKK